MRIYFLSLLISSIFFVACNDKAEQKPVSKDSLNVPPPPTSGRDYPEEDNQLIGTTVLRSSEKNLHSGYLYGLWLDSIYSSACQNMGEGPPPIKITSIQQPYDSILIVNAMVTGNCGYSFLGEIDVLQENTINLVYTGYGSSAVCACCYGLTYVIQLSDQGEYPFKKLKYISINGHDKRALPSLRVPIDKLK
jgi:hypothetical protein